MAYYPDESTAITGIDREADRRIEWMLEYVDVSEAIDRMRKQRAVLDDEIAAAEGSRQQLRDQLGEALGFVNTERQAMSEATR